MKSKYVPGKSVHVAQNRKTADRLHPISFTLTILLPSYLTSLIAFSLLFFQSHHPIHHHHHHHPIILYRRQWHSNPRNHATQSAHLLDIAPGLVRRRPRARRMGQCGSSRPWPRHLHRPPQLAAQRHWSASRIVLRVHGHGCVAGKLDRLFAHQTNVASLPVVPPVLVGSQEMAAMDPLGT
jgi:hypothetical protein